MLIKIQFCLVNSLNFLNVLNRPANPWDFAVFLRNNDWFWALLWNYRFSLFGKEN